MPLERHAVGRASGLGLVWILALIILVIASTCPSDRFIARHVNANVKTTSFSNRLLESGKGRRSVGWNSKFNSRPKIPFRASIEDEMPPTDQRAKALDNVLKEVNSRFGSGAVMKLGDTKQYKPEVTPTGALTLDLALGGGWPKGRIVEIYGPESSGKTTVALHAMAEVQRRGGQAALIDAEHAFDADYASRLGVDVPNLILCQPDSGEMGLEVVDSLVRSGAVDLIAVDSVAALAPRVEIEGEIGTVTVGAQARLMSHALRKLTPIAAKSKCTILFLNQIRYKVGVLYGNPEITSGGNALKFYASVRLEIRIKGRIEADGKQKGNNVKTKVVKNKCAPPYKIAEFDIIFGKGINTLGCVLDVAESLGVVERRGSYYFLDGNRIAQGRDNTLEVLSSNATMRAEVEESIRIHFDA